MNNIGWLNDIDDGLKNYVKTSVECVKGAYDTGYKNGKNEAYKSPIGLQDARIEGRREAWELAKKIFLDSDKGGLTRNELIDIFNSGDPSIIAITYSASSALKMFEEYYKEKERRDIESFDDLVSMHGADKVKEWLESRKG